MGARLDEKPELFFTLRGVDVQDLITSASATATAALAGAPAADAGLADADLSALFGVELETRSAATASSPAKATAKSRAAGKRPPVAKRKAAARKKSAPKAGPKKSNSKRL